MQPVQPLIKVKKVTIPEAVTLNSNGYLDMSSYRPSGMNHFLFALIQTWSTNNPKVAFNLTSNGMYLVGSANMWISGLEIVYYYTD